MRFHAIRLFTIASITALASAGHCAPITVEIVTAILPRDPQAGIKSTQALKVDFEKKTVTQEFKTGVTNIGVTDLKSIRDKFVVQDTSFADPKRAYFKVQGQTASGVIFLPNINYTFRIAITPTGTGAIEGCHDGYPAYQVKVAGKKVYGFDHQPVNIGLLFGACDIIVPTSNF